MPALTMLGQWSTGAEGGCCFEYVPSRLLDVISRTDGEGSGSPSDAVSQG